VTDWDTPWRFTMLPGQVPIVWRTKEELLAVQGIMRGEASVPPC